MGERRVWIDPERAEEVEVAITREEIGRLVHEGAIRARPEEGVSRARARVLREKKKKGRGRGPGGRSGSAGAGVSEKGAWMKRVRALRRSLREWKANRVVTRSTYRHLYDMAGSGAFESRADMERYARAHGLWRGR